MVRDRMREAVRAVGTALREPEAFARRWEEGDERYPPAVWMGLLATAAAGTATYGMTMGMLGGPAVVAHGAVFLTLAAGLAWLVPLPAIYILNAFGGSRLAFGSLALAAAVTVSWGGLALMASIPINWFFTVAVPKAPFVMAVNLVVFSGVGVCMADVFRRVMERLEPGRGRTAQELLVFVGILGAELIAAFDLFRFGV